MIAETIDLDAYTVEIHYDTEAANPIRDYDAGAVLALHEGAERHFGWTTDPEWADRLQGALNEIGVRGYTRNLYGKRGALEVINRWLRVFYGIPVVLPVGGGDHSGHWAYLGTSEHWCDPGGWDSGWVGWLFFTPEALRTGWGDATPEPAEIERSLTAHFKEFEAWVSGNCYGFIVTRDGEHIGSCWGFYGSDSWGESEDAYMRQEFMAAIDLDRNRRQVESDLTDEAEASDTVEIDEMRLAEVLV